VRCSAGTVPYLSRMSDTRFELRLSVERRRELAELSAELGLSSSDLVRLAIGRLLVERRDFMPGVAKPREGTLGGR
jgi:predicted DNA-binding protein